MENKEKVWKATFDIKREVILEKSEDYWQGYGHGKDDERLRFAKRIKDEIKDKVLEAAPECKCEACKQVDKIVDHLSRDENK